MLGRTLELTAVSSHTSADHPFRSWPNNPMLVSMAENRRAVAAWSAGVSAVAVAFAAIIASRATTSLSRNAWFVACLVVALIAFAILLAAGVPDIISWLRERKDKPARHSTLADAQLRDHFESRARGILPSQIREGSYFTGRMKVLGELSSWLAQSDGADYRARVVTGAPGSGKSAVLGRLIGLASPRLRSEWIGSGATGAQLKTALPPGLAVTAGGRWQPVGLPVGPPNTPGRYYFGRPYALALLCHETSPGDMIERD
jgi:hypothetical protein